MPRASDSVLILFPGALGDFLCFLPTVIGLRARHAGAMRLVAKSELLDLVRLPGATTASIDRREIADLFAAGVDLAPQTRELFAAFTHVYSWTGFDDPDFARRLAMASGGDVHMYRFRGMQPGEHAVDYYVRCVGLAPGTVRDADINDDPRWLAAFRQQHRLDDRLLLVIHPGSGAPHKNWQGFDAVMRYWCGHYTDAVVLLRGPAEGESATTAPTGVIPVSGLTLPQVAALLRDSDLYLGNDSGVSHLAGAVGARGVVLFGPSDPTVWAPRSTRLQIIHAAEVCPHCGTDAFCVHRLPADSVIRALGTQRRNGRHSAQL